MGEFYKRGMLHYFSNMQLHGMSSCWLQPYSSQCAVHVIFRRVYMYHFKSCSDSRCRVVWWSKSSTCISWTKSFLLQKVLDNIQSYLPETASFPAKQSYLLVDVVHYCIEFTGWFFLFFCAYCACVFPAWLTCTVQYMPSWVWFMDALLTSQNISWPIDGIHNAVFLVCFVTATLIW